MAAHELKTWPDVFQEIVEGRKRHEYRRNDRGFMLWDHVLLQEWDPMEEKYTGHSYMCQITSISYGPEWGIPEGFAVFTIDPR